MDRPSQGSEGRPSFVDAGARTLRKKLPIGYLLLNGPKKGTRGIMWQCDAEPLARGRVQRYVPRRDGSALRYRDVMRYWQDDASFRTFFISLLMMSKFAGYRWETPPVTSSTIDREFEFVLLDAPELARPPDERAFAQQFETATAGQSVVTFPNLGNDAVLLVPCPAGPAAAYVHLASFVRSAPSAQVHELWRSVGAAMEARLSAAPTWLSTAGMGVAWLHVRIDSRPKYYGYAPYREQY